MNLLKNSYVLGLLMVVAEIVSNFALLAVHLSHVSGLFVASGAGALYAALHKQEMPPQERLKALGVYIGISLILGVALVLNQPPDDIGLAFGIVLAVLVVYAVIMYFLLKFGSAFYLRSNKQ
ncbi:MAG TPA: hypothetical protein VGP13_02560 [Candidatus Paceibacterota bacterium]|nr:hypothetical protein [Candidatus Paceibacterota bacterium]